MLFMTALRAAAHIGRCPDMAKAMLSVFISCLFVAARNAVAMVEVVTARMTVCVLCFVHRRFPPCPWLVVGLS